MNYSFLLYSTIFLVSYILTTKILHKFRNLPPSPFLTLPILGHIHYLLKDPNIVHRTLSKLSGKYGPVVHLQIGSRPTILVSSASAAEECLSTNDIIFASRPHFIGTETVGYGGTTMIWAPYGPIWKNHRRIASTEILSPLRLNLLSDIRAEEVKFIIQRIYEAKEVQVMEIKKALMGLTNNVMMRMIAGKKIFGEAVESNDAKRFNEMVKDLYGSPFSAADFFPFLKYVGVDKLDHRRFKAIFVKLDGFFQDLVDEQRDKLKDDVDCGDSGNKKINKNLIQVLLDLQKTEPGYSTDIIIKGLIQILLLAGSETSASTMEWALACLLKNPNVMKRAKQEIDDQVGTERLLEESDLAHLPYLHCIINETLRMYPAAPILLPRQSSAECMVGGFKVPKGTLMLLNLWDIHNDPMVWDEPWVFKPERFEGVKGDRVGYQFMPFSSGRRACPGENLAMRMVGLTLGSLIQCFDMESVEEFDMAEMVSLSMWKAKPLKAMFKPRKEMIDLLSRVLI